MQVELLNQQKNGRFPDESVKIKCAQVHSEGGQRGSNSSHKGSSVRGTIITINTIVTNLVSGSLIQCPIYVSRSEQEEGSVIARLPQLCVLQVENQGNRCRSVNQVGGKLDVSTSLTQILSHLLSLFLWVLRNRSAISSTVQSWVFLAPEWTVQVLT